MYSTWRRYTILPRDAHYNYQPKMESFRKLKAPFMLLMALVMVAPMLAGAVQYAKSLFG